MDYDYNFENADYLTTLDSIRGSLYKVVANVNKELFSIGEALKEKEDPELISKKEKLEALLKSIIDLADSIADNFVEIDTIISGKKPEEKSVGVLPEISEEEKKAFNSELIREALAKTSSKGASAGEEVKEETPTEETKEENVPSEESPAVEENAPAVEVKEEVANTESTGTIEPPIEATAETANTEEAVEAPKEEEAPVEDAAPSVTTDTPSVYVANKTDDGVAKAILVTDDQFKKLDASRDSQTALCKFRELLVGEKPVETKNDLEALMEKANQLYQDGNLAEAEKLYNQISELNKANS